MQSALPPRLKAVGREEYLQTRIDARSNVEEDGGIAAQLYTACLDVLADLYRIFAKNDFNESHTVASADLVVKPTDRRIGHTPRTYNIRADGNDDKISDGIFAHRNLLGSSQRDHTSGTIAKLESSGKRSIKDALGKLFLWGEDLMDGGLDRALGESDELRDHVLELLCGIAIVLRHRLLPLVAVQTPRGALKRRLQYLDSLMAHPILITSRDCTETSRLGDDTEEVYFSESDVSCRGGSSKGEITDIETHHCRVLEIGKELKFRIQCLMDLLPTLEQNIDLVELRRKPPKPLTPPPFGYNQAKRIAAEGQRVRIPERQGVFIHQRNHFSPQPDRCNPPSDGYSSPPDGFNPPPDRFIPPPPDQFILPQASFLHELAHPIYLDNDRRYQETHNALIPYHHGRGNLHDRSEFRDGLPGEQANKTKKDDKAKAGDQKPKGDSAKKDKKGQHADVDQFESDFLDSSSSDDSVFSAAETNQTQSTATDRSCQREEKRHSSDQRDGYRSSHRSRERDHDDYERGNYRDHVPRETDSQRSSRGSHEIKSIRQHRRKSPLRSSSSSPSGGSRYVLDEKMYATNGRRGRRGFEYSLKERPAFHSRNDSYEEARPQRKPGMYTAERMSGMSDYIRPVEVFDQTDEQRETVRAQVKQVLEKEKMEELKRENERLKEERYRTEPMMSTDLPRSRRFEADLQSNRYPYGY
ncbi:hypothetical protein MMC22_001150 [Lobaria immixta]|nr:hypothetical protein [Lobaria immixta]